MYRVTIRLTRKIRRASLVEELDEGVGVAVEDVRVLSEEQRAAEADAVAEEEPVEVQRLVAGDSCSKRIRLGLRCGTFFYSRKRSEEFCLSNGTKCNFKIEMHCSARQDIINAKSCSPQASR